MICQPKPHAETPRNNEEIDTPADKLNWEVGAFAFHAGIVVFSFILYLAAPWLVSLFHNQGAEAITNEVFYGLSLAVATGVVYYGITIVRVLLIYSDYQKLVSNGYVAPDKIA
jgi:hypothetical protein